MFPEHNRWSTDSEIFFIGDTKGFSNFPVFLIAESAQHACLFKNSIRDESWASFFFFSVALLTGMSVLHFGSCPGMQFEKCVHVADLRAWGPAPFIFV